MSAIFLSSRFVTFDEMRPVLQQALTDAGHDVVNLDDGLASSLDPQERSRRGLDDCDAMLLLLDDTYGSPVEGISLTEHEFTWAREAGKPILAFAKPLGPQAHPDAVRFLDGVQEEVTVGVLSPHGRDIVADVGRMCETVNLELAGLAADDDAGGSPMLRLLLDLKRLGLEGMDAFPADRFPGRRRQEVLEQRMYAVRALRAGHLNQAWDYLDKAMKTEVPDWAAAYVAARVAELRRRPKDMKRAYLYLMRGQNEGCDRDAAPLEAVHGRTPTSAAEHWRIADRERRAAGAALLARLRRHTEPTDAHTAKAHAQDALELVPQSQEAHVEKVLASARVDGVGEAWSALKTLLGMYPDAGVAALALVEDPDTRGELDRLAASRVRAVHREATGNFPRARRERLRGESETLAELRGYRATAKAAREGLGQTVIGLAVEHPQLSRGEPVRSAAARVAACERAAAAEAARGSTAEAYLTAQLPALDGELGTPQAMRSWIAGEQQRLQAIVGSRWSMVGLTRSVEQPESTLRMLRLVALVPGIALGAAWVVCAVVSGRTDGFVSGLFGVLARISLVLLSLGALMVLFVAALALVREARYVVLTAARRRHDQAVADLASLQRAEDNVTTRELARHQARQAEEAVAAARSALTAARRDFAAQCKAAGISGCSDVGQLADQVAARVNAYRDSFARYPRWADHRLRAQASVTGVGPRYASAETSGGLLGGLSVPAVGDRRRLLRPYSSGAYGDLAYFAPGEPAVEAFERALNRRLLAADGGAARCPLCGAPGGMLCQECGHGQPAVALLAPPTVEERQLTTTLGEAVRQALTKPALAVLGCLVATVALMGFAW